MRRRFNLCFVPDETKHFLGEAVLIAMSGVFVGAFLKGVNSALRKKDKNWE